MNIIENVNRLEDYLINESEISLIDIQKISTYLTNIREEAINYTRCSMELKVKETMTFEEWCDVNGVTKVAFNMFMKDGNCLSLGKVSDMYEAEQNL